MSYLEDTRKKVKKYADEQESLNAERRKRARSIPSPSNSLKVADNSSANPVDTSTGMVKTSRNLADRGYSSTVNDFKTNNTIQNRTPKSMSILMGSDISDYNNMTIGEGYKSGSYTKNKATKAKAEELKSKYNLSDDELDKINRQYTRNKIQKAENKGVEKAAENAQNHVVTAEIARTALSPLSSAEGYGNVISAKIGRDKNSQESFIRRLRDANASGLDNKIENSNMSKGAKKFANIGTGLLRSGADMATQYAVAAATGLPMGAISAGNAMNDTMASSIERGSDLNKASNVALTNGVIDYVLAQYGLDEIAKLSKSGKNVASTIAKSMGIEGSEELVQNVLSQLADTTLNYNNSQFKQLKDRKGVAGALKDMAIEDAQAFGGGAVFGGILSGAKATFPRLTAAKTNTNNNVNVDPEVANITTEEELQRYIDKVRQENSAEKITEQGVNSNTLTTPENVPIDNGGVSDILNNVSDERSIENGRLERSNGNDGTGSEDVLRTVPQSESVGQREYRNRVEGGEFLPTNRIPVTDVITKGNKIFDDAEIEKYSDTDLKFTQFYSTDGEPDLYARALSTAMSNNPNGAAVDPRSAEDVAEIISKGGKSFLCDDGTAGALIEGDGNLTGVFKDSLNNKTPRMGVNIAIAAVKNGATKGDCFGRFLVNTYSRSGLEPVARMKYAYGFNEAMDAQVRQQLADGVISSEPDVYMLKIRDDFDPSTVMDNYKTAKQYTQEELDALPLFEDYDEMGDYRDRLLGKQAVSPTEYGSYSANTIAESVNDGTASLTVDPNSLKPNSEVITNTPVNNAAVSENPNTSTASAGNGKGQSKVITNTGVNSGVYEADEVLNDPNVRRIMEYDRASNKESMERAVKNFTSDAETFRKNFSDGTWKIESDTDVDTAQLILQDLKINADIAFDSGDVASANALKAQRDLLALKLRFAGTKAGQFIQAFAKWNYTPEGAVMNAERILSSRATKAISGKQNKAIKSMSTKLLNALDKLVDDGTIIKGSESSLDMIRQQVRNTINAEMASTVDSFTDSDVDYLANIINQGATTDELAKMLQTKLATGQFSISDATIKEVNELFAKAENYGKDSKARVELENEAFRLLANESCANATIWEKFESWRYLAMLGNPKTHIRNIIGNSMFSTVTGVSNNLAAVMEEIYAKSGKKIQRTKAVLNRANEADNALIKAAREDAELNAFRQLSGTKYADSKSGIEANKEVFKSKVVKFLNNLNDKALSGEDTLAMIKKYSTSLAGYLKANGLDANALKAEQDIVSTKNTLDNVKNQLESNKNMIKNLEAKSKIHPLDDLQAEHLAKLKRSEADLSNQIKALNEQLDILGGNAKIVREGREYAIKQAEYSAFHEDNVVAETLQKLSSDLRNSDNGVAKVLGYGVEGLIPFKKTPANILRSGYDYSPLSIMRVFKDIKTEADASHVIEDLSKTLTGTGIMLLGMWMAKRGYLNINNDDQKYTNPSEGKQQYSLNIGGKNFTIDFAVPSVMPLLVGAEWANLQEIDNDFDMEQFCEAISSKEFGEAIRQGVSLVSPYVTAALDIASPIAETSMLSGINDTIESLQSNKEGGAGGQLLLNTGLGYFSQGVPTLLGQVARTIDPLRRSTYTDQTGTAGTIDKKLTKTLNKIPFISKGNEPYVDANGRTQNNSPFNSVLGNAAYQFLSPTYIQDINPTEVERQSDALYEQSTQNDRNKFLMNSETSYTIDNKRLSKSDYTTWSKEYGTVRNELRDAMLNSDYFKNLDDSQKLQAFKDMDSMAKKVAEYNLAQSGTSDLNDGQIESATGNNTIAKWLESNSNASDYVSSYAKKNTNKAAATNLGLTNKKGEANTDLYEKAISLGEDSPLIQNVSNINAYLQEKGETYGSANKEVFKEALLKEPLTDEERGQIVMATGKCSSENLKEAYESGKVSGAEAWKMYESGDYSAVNKKNTSSSVKLQSNNSEKNTSTNVKSTGDTIQDAYTFNTGKSMSQSGNTEVISYLNRQSGMSDEAKGQALYNSRSQVGKKAEQAKSIGGFSGYYIYCQGKSDYENKKMDYNNDGKVRIDERIKFFESKGLPRIDAEKYAKIGF